MHVAKCEICGKSFAAKYPNSKYCCYECRSLADRLRRRNWNKDNPHYMSDYYKRRKGTQNTH